MKTECPGKLEIFSTWLFTEYVCQPQSRVKKQNKPALSFPHDLPLKGWVLWGCPYQVKWLTLVKDFLCLRVNPHRHLNFCVFHQELTPTPIGTKAVFRCSLASSTRNTRNGVVHIRKGSQDQDAQPHPGLWLWFCLGTELLVTSQLPCRRWTLSYVLTGGTGRKCVHSSHIWSESSSLTFLNVTCSLPAGQMQTVQWRALRFRAGCPIKLSGMMESFRSALSNTVASGLMRLLRIGLWLVWLRKWIFTFRLNGAYDLWLVIGLRTSAGWQMQMWEES